VLVKVSYYRMCRLLHARGFSSERTQVGAELNHVRELEAVKVMEVDGRS
jgi:hypothetical protein